MGPVEAQIRRHTTEREAANSFKSAHLEILNYLVTLIACYQRSADGLNRAGCSAAKRDAICRRSVLLQPTTFDLRPLADRQRADPRLTLCNGLPGVGRRHAHVAARQNKSWGRSLMTTMAVNAPRTGGMTSEERLVIFASSLGTVFEWYDFYIYGTLGVFLAKYFFSNVPAECRLHLRAARVRRRLRGPPVRRADLRPFRRHDRPQIHLPHHHEPDGHRHVLHRRAAGLCHVGNYRADRADCAAPGPGPRTRRRIWRRGDLRRRTCAANKRGYYTSWIQTTATLGLFLALLLILGIRTAMGEAAFGDWGWRIPFLLSAILLAVSLWIRLKLNESPLFRAHGRRRQAIQAAVDRSLRPMVEPEDRDPGLVRRHRRRSRRLVWRAVLRPVLPDADLESAGDDRRRS